MSYGFSAQDRGDGSQGAIPRALSSLRLIPIEAIILIGSLEERVVYRERFQSVEFDFRGKIVFARYDCCEFVKCTLLIDAATQQLAFTACVFKDCNIDQVRSHESRGFYAVNNFFDRPIEERRADFEKRLAQALAARKASG